MIHILEPRRAGVQSATVNTQMPVVTDGYLLASQSDQALDVKLILRQAFDAFGLEHNDFPSFGTPKVVAETIDEEMVAAGDPELDDVFAFPERLAGHES
mgnify:CR=1 FL=1